MYKVLRCTELPNLVGRSFPIYRMSGCGQYICLNVGSGPFFDLFTQWFPLGDVERVVEEDGQVSQAWQQDGI